MNRITLFRQILPGLAPLIIFVVAEWIWGPRIGLLVAVGFGLGELVVSLVKHKKADKLVLIDLLLIVLLGGVSILLENDLFFKIKPVVVGAIISMLMVALAFLPFNGLQAMQKRYMPSLQLDAWQQYEMKKSLGRISFFLIVYTLLTLGAAIWASNAVWGVVSGAGLFVAFALWAGFEYFIKKRKSAKYANQEWLPLVDEQGKVIGQAPRSELHAGTKLLHPVVHLHLVTQQGIYLQKRPASKLIQPNKWDTAVGGHIDVNESVDTALRRETVEEIGITNFTANLVDRYVWRSKVEHELVFLFITTNCTQEPQPNATELNGGRFWTIDEIENNLGKAIFTPNFEYEYITYLKSII